MATPSSDSNSSGQLASSASIRKAQIAAIQALQSLFPSGDEQPLLPITIEKAAPRTPLASSAPLGLLGFALVSILAAVPKLENRSPTDGLLFVVALFLGGFAQVMAAVLQYVANELLAATTFALFGLHWAAQAALLLARHDERLSFANDLDASEGAVYYVTITTATIMLWVASLRKNRVLNAALFFVIFAFGFDVPAAFGHRWAQVGSAVAAIAASLIALYMALVDFVNDAWRAPILPLFPLAAPELVAK